MKEIINFVDAHVNGKTLFTKEAAAPTASRRLFQLNTDRKSGIYRRS